ncbi:hypothetical protein CLAVI_001028 [Candidatus Clavichlamydia salmonicola]|uniref:hypothetical protein n=1 Tax=Candidatus Clavichlamydia salmonicola TaxID=469812 RepID=UPI001891BE7C|nr:hypothetical protein [Candidatus Clavichlamydia salmonicola]MBF5051384.1 hypothetical protein [Candidatus Clavichlamydia salmonicola]
MSNVSTPASFSTAIPVTTAMPVEENIYLLCNTMMITFGVGRALVLTAILSKIIYKQWKAKSPKKSKSFSRKSRNLAASEQEAITVIAEDGTEDPLQKDFVVRSFSK